MCELNPETPPTDSELLHQFVADGDRASLEEIVQRHGPLVLGVCRRMLGDVHETEDVYQATFLVLVKSAARIWKRKSLTSWLYGVAYRLSLKARRNKYRGREEPLMETAASEDSPFEQIARRSDEQVVDEELQRLPDKYRRPLLLHYLTNRTNKEIARELGMSVTAVEGRLKRGRAELRRRLHRRGITAAAFVAAIGFSQRLAEAAQTDSLLVETIDSCASFAGQELALDHAAHQLAQTEITEMALATKKLVSLAAATLVASCLGLYGITSLVTGQEPAADSQRQTIRVAPGSPAAASNAPTTKLVVSGRASQTGSVNEARRAIEAIESALKTKLADVRFSGELLEAVGQYFAKELKIQVLIDWKSLEDFGYTKDSVLDIELQAANISARSALRLALDQVDLEYVLTNEVLLITTPEAAESNLDARVYASLRDLDSLVELITSSIAPDTWSETGGPGTIQQVADVGLVVSQTQSVHEKVADLLEQLDRAESEARNDSLKKSKPLR